MYSQFITQNNLFKTKDLMLELESRRLLMNLLEKPILILNILINYKDGSRKINTHAHHLTMILRCHYKLKYSNSTYRNKTKVISKLWNKRSLLWVDRIQNLKVTKNFSDTTFSIFGKKSSIRMLLLTKLNLKMSLFSQRKLFLMK